MGGFDAAPPRRAFVTVVARGPGHGIRPWNVNDSVNFASGLREPEATKVLIALTTVLACSYKRWRSKEKYPLVAITANLTHDELSELRLSGVDHVVDMSGFASWEWAPPWIRQPSLPVTTPPWRMDCAGGKGWSAMNRQDFPKTMLKYHAWNLTDLYDEFVHIDADTFFTGGSDHFFDVLRRADAPGSRHGCRAPCARIEFAADKSNRPCAMVGWQSSIMVAHTSQRRFQSLLQRTYLGDFSPFTNSDQDVLDAEFPPPCSPIERVGAQQHDCSSSSWIRPIGPIRHERFFKGNLPRVKTLACQVCRGAKAYEDATAAWQNTTIAVMEALASCPCRSPRDSFSSFGDTMQKRAVAQMLGLPAEVLPVSLSQMCTQVNSSHAEIR